jgi:hypothetical protein
MDWTDACWPPDAAFALIKAGLLQGKSIGFVRLKSHGPSSHEIAAKPELATVSRIIDEWLLLEYACTFLPTNQKALVESVSKSQIEVPADWLKLAGLEVAPAPVVPFTALSEVEAAVRRALAGINPRALAAKAVRDACDKARGRV